MAFAHCNRRSFLVSSAAAATQLGWRPSTRADEKPNRSRPAQIAITLDLEMSRNFPRRQDTHWDYEKGNLDEAAKAYTSEACRRVRDRGSFIHTFVVGQVFEQPDVDWLKEIAAQGHPIGNHTYDHVYVLAKDLASLQFRFQRAPWLIENLTPMEVIRQNIVLTNKALKHRVGVDAAGFRTPGGFANGLNGREDLQQLLLNLGFPWVSCTYPSHAIQDIQGTQEPPSDEVYQSIVEAQAVAQPFVYPTGLVDVPMSPISDIGAFRNGRWTLPHFLKAIRLAMDWVIEQHAAFDFLAHPSCLGIVDPKFESLDLICNLVEQAGEQAELVDLGTLAERVTDNLAPNP